MQKRIIFSFILTGAIFLQIPLSYAQTYTTQYSLNWQIITNIQNKKINAPYFLGFQNATYKNAQPATPVFSANISIPTAGKVSVVLQNQVYVPITDSVLTKELGYPTNSIIISDNLTELNHQPLVAVNFVPIRKNPVNGQLEKLTTFSIFLTVAPSIVNNPISFSQSKRGASGSLLASGNWYKFGVTQTGIYKLDFNFLKSVGVSAPSDLNNVKIYGRPGGMLPQPNAVNRDSDLVQNALQLVMPSGSLDASSYVLFYAKGPTTWSYDPGSAHFHHQINYYSDVSYYFITVNGDAGTVAKRIKQANPITSTPTNEITGFDAYDYHELDTVTALTLAVKSGREWYGESFDMVSNTTLRHPINFDFPQADPSQIKYMRTSTAARSFPDNATFAFSIDNGNSILLYNQVAGLPSTDDFDYQYANGNDDAEIKFTTQATHFTVQVQFSSGAQDALGWLNYVEFNVKSQLKYIKGQGQFGFRNGYSDTFDVKPPQDTTLTFNAGTVYIIGSNAKNAKADTIYIKPSAKASWPGIANGDIATYVQNVDSTYIIYFGDTINKFKGNTWKVSMIDTLTRVNRYHIANAPTSNYQVWDVTDFHNVASEPLVAGNDESTFLSHGDVLREFVFTDGSNFMTPQSASKIDNQNLHSLPQADMVIVAYPDFIPAADSVAAFHLQHDNMIVTVVTPDQIYNEFSSGTQDVSAIRDFMKMFYDRSTSIGTPPRFLLLIGAASFDYKSRISPNTNYVPVYEGTESLEASISFCSDDYFTLLSNDEGAWPDGTSSPLQLSVGRFPVYTLQQAMDIYHKTLRYVNPKNMGDWRNKICIIADDRESDLFFDSAEDLADNTIGKQHPEMNVIKLYLDATPELNSPAGQLFPQINTDIDQNVNNGCLIMNYIGHGGQQGWAHEKVLTIPDIQSWNNLYNMPLIISATCQFSTFDDPTNVSAGQLALFNPTGGPFAMLTTVREVYIDANAQLNSSILSNNILDKVSGQAKYIGDAFKQGKNSINNPNSSNFELLGDPAVRLAIPQNTIKVTKIVRDSLPSDTFKALSLMTVSGEIVSGSNIMSSFNGDIFPTVFDKIEVKHTLGQAFGDPNDPDSPEPFNTQENVIYKGNSTVINGKFSFQFVVPKDISFDYGIGKLSFYADNHVTDANGYSDSIIVGGSSIDTVGTHKSPVVHLYMNDTTFLAGGLVNENPSLVARVRSNLGINTLGTIGHDLTATLSKIDDPSVTDNTVILDDFYTADKNSYQSGTITYPFSELSDGHYSLSIIVWDVADNWASASTDFIVVNSSNLTIDKIFNYPNPFRDETTFEFEHNRPNETLNVDISIYDLNGKLVRDLQSDVSTSGDRQTSIQWNGTETGGAKIASGLYVYRLTVSTLDGQIAQKSQKMIVIK